MGGVVDLREVLEIQMCVDLRRRDVRMPEQFLHGAQITGRFEHVRRERMAQHVRMNMHTAAVELSTAREAQLH